MFDEILSAGVGLLVYSKEKAEQFIDLLVEKGEMQQEEARKLVNRLVEKGREEKERYQEQMKEKYDTAVREKIITKEDFRRLEGKLDDLIALVKETKQ